MLVSHLVQSSLKAGSAKKAALVMNPEQKQRQLFSVYLAHHRAKQNELAADHDADCNHLTVLCVHEL